MNRRFFRMLLVWIAMLARVAGADFAEANRRFESGDFAGAAKIYQELAGSGAPGAALLYNLGNSQYRLGEYGAAILSYERAKLLSPRDPDLLANLALARKSAAVFEVPAFDPRVDAVLTYLSRHEWSWLVVVSALWLGGLAVIFGAGRVTNPAFRKCAAASAALAAVLIAFGTTALILRRDEGNRGIVLAKDAGVLLSPFEKAESLGTPGAGRIVMMGEKSGGYHFVRVPGTGLEGWMRDGTVAWIAP